MPPRPTRKSKKYHEPTNVQSRAVRGKRGILENLPNLPLDVIYEILSRCSPLDLLRLARTTKAFRTLLMSRSSIAIWRSARELSSDRQVVGIPECPPYLSEPAYANLAFDAHCHSCLANNIHEIMWEFRKRYCTKCQGFMMISTYLTQYKLEKEYGKNVQRIYEKHKSSFTGSYYHKPDLSAFKKSMANMSTADERDAFIQMERDFTTLVHKHAKLQKEWSASRPSRSDEIYETRERMITSVITHLKSLGWEEELGYMGDNPKPELLKIPCLSKDRDITDRIWTNIEATIVKYMEEYKVARLERGREAVLIGRFRLMEQVIVPSLLALSETTTVPHVIDICLMDEVRMIIDTPATINLTAADFAPLISHLPTLAKRWHANIELEYLQHVSSNEHTAAPDSVLDLVTSCKRCGGILFFPDSLVHECHNLPRGRRKEDQPKYKKNRTWQETEDIRNGIDLIRRLPVYERAARDLSAYVPWSCEQDSFEKEIAVVRKIVEACGKRPNKVTCTQMDHLDVRLSCDLCSQNGRMVVVTWRSAIHHALESHSHGTSKCRSLLNVTWTLVRDDARARAIEIESSVKLSHGNESNDELYCCAICKHQFTPSRSGFNWPCKWIKRDVFIHLHYKSVDSTYSPVILSDTNDA
ncbi:hypothetical protein PILCRDRAFT_814671 [Piloderma croceum F 1598]|uniref:F-box domain-containing protein n=1 Tax=Piloderma croceum (strain F 1598) TaxID=765440 RepID=A0A0C3GBJ1_PILCF|nr:hypothetical protein PILCRDRAFT_814671 [Piloderma croceum F 1598]